MIKEKNGRNLGNKRLLAVRIVAVLFIALSMIISPLAQSDVYGASGQIDKRIKQVQKDFPHHSRINQMIKVPVIYSQSGFGMFTWFNNGGCNALVAYTTLKVFHNPYVPGSTSYKKVGSAKTGSVSSMKKLFKKAKKGDVIRWHSGSEERHFGIFLSMNGSGISVYEGNYNGKNKVWIHQVSWSALRRTSNSARDISVYRSKNYASVNKGKAAKNLSKGKKFTYNGITYKVVKTGLRCGKVRVVKKSDSAGATPKAIALNYDTSKRLISFGEKEWDDAAIEVGEDYKVRTYSSKKGRYCNEQYFIVVD